MGNVKHKLPYKISHRKINHAENFYYEGAKYNMRYIVQLISLCFIFKYLLFCVNKNISNIEVKLVSKVLLND